MERFLGEDCIHAYMRRWNTLPHSLYIREYHSPNRLREALKRVPLYKHSMQSLKVHWIDLKLSPPLILGLLEGIEEEEEKEQREKLDAKVGFHDREEDLISEPWKDIKVIKDEEMD